MKTLLAIILWMTVIIVTVVMILQGFYWPVSMRELPEDAKVAIYLTYIQILLTIGRYILGDKIRFSGLKVAKGLAIAILLAHVHYLLLLYLWPAIQNLAYSAPITLLLLVLACAVLLYGFLLGYVFVRSYGSHWMALPLLIFIVASPYVILGIEMAWGLGYHLISQFQLALRLASGATFIGFLGGFIAINARNRSGVAYKEEIDAFGHVFLMFVLLIGTMLVFASRLG